MTGRVATSQSLSLPSASSAACSCAKRDRVIHGDFRRVRLFENSRRSPHSLHTAGLLGPSWSPISQWCVCSAESDSPAGGTSRGPLLEPPTVGQQRGRQKAKSLDG